MALAFFKDDAGNQGKEGTVEVKDASGQRRKVSFRYDFIVSNSDNRPSLEDLNSEFQRLELDLSETLRAAINEHYRLTAFERAVNLDKIQSDPEAAKKAAVENIKALMVAGVLSAEAGQAAIESLK